MGSDKFAFSILFVSVAIPFGSYLSLFSVAITKYQRLCNLYRIEVSLAHGSGGREVQDGSGICLATGERLLAAL